MGFGRVGTKDLEELRIREQLVQPHFADAEAAHIALRYVWIVGDQRKAERRELVDHVLRDPAEANEAASHAAKAVNGAVARTPMPAPRAGRGDVMVQPTKKGEGKGDGVVGNL